MPKQVSSVDTRQFNQMCRQFAKEVNVPLPAVLKAEVGKVLETAVKYTASAKVSKITKRYEDFVPMGQDAYSPKRIRRFGNLIGPNLIYYMQNRYPRELWSRLLARRRELIARKRAARGLAKQSWLQLADALGVPISVPGYVNTAIPSTGQTYKNVSVSEKATDKGAEISISNAQPTINAIGGAGILQRATDGRSKYFYENMKRGVFNSLKEVARAYPGMKIAA